jgi:protein-disulfide isomerase
MAIQGSASAKVAVIEYSDFQCPYCGRFARETLPALEKNYVNKNQILLAFANVPLSIHPFALRAAVASNCAGQQNRFWPMHDGLFANQQRLDEAGLQEDAKTAGLDIGRFERCLGSSAVDAVKRGADEARALQVVGTPTFFIGTLQSDGRVGVSRRFSGSLTAEQFSAVLDSAIASATSVSTASTPSRK